MAVVCAGVKSILDIGLTLEKLETLGVPVLGYGTDEFPAFYSRSSGLRRTAARRLARAEIAALMRAKWDLGIAGGIVVANPIPAEPRSRPSEIDAIIDQALADMDPARHHRQGHHAVPARPDRRDHRRRHLTANIALVEHNARLGAAIAREHVAP